MKMIKTGIICAGVMVTAMSAFAADIVEIDGVQGVDSGSTTTSTSVLNKETEGPNLVGDTRYDTITIENAVEKARADLVIASNSVKTMVFMKANPVRANLENFEIGSPKDMQDLSVVIANYLKADFDLLSEQDKKAISMIPIDGTSYKMPAVTEISVMGASRIQAFPLVVNGETIGHFRTTCGGFDKEDVIINRKSVSYCVASLIATGVTRNSGVHKGATTPVYYIGVTDPYIVGGIASKVKINWATNPKSTTKGTLAYYNLLDVPNALETLDYKNNLTTSNGEVLTGINPRLSR